MKAIGLTEFGGPEVLHVVDLPTPEPGPGEVRIRVHAAGVNPTDATFRSGGRATQLADRPRPFVPGMDVAGVVEKLGDDADGRLAVGDSVIAYVIPFGRHGGAYAQQLVADQRSVIHAPRDVSMPEAATLLLNGVTAHLALDVLNLPPDYPIAVIGAAGGVGGYAVEMAHAHGLTVVADAAPADADLVGSFGAHVVTRGNGVASRVRDVVPDGVAGLIDTAGVNAVTLPAIKDEGVLISVKGWDGPGERGIDVTPISSFGSATNTEVLETVRQMADDGIVTFRVADVLPAAQAVEAHRRLEAGGIRGRLVLDFTTPL